MTLRSRCQRFALVTTVALAAVACRGRPAGPVLYESRSEFNQIVVEESAGLRTLRFERGGALQSQVRLGKPLDLQLEYTRAAMAAVALVRDPSRILVVGLGGGAMPMFLKTSLPTSTIDVVELDPEVVAVARRFFEVREDARLKIHTGDGRAFIESSKEKWDLIFLDAFGTNSIPRSLATLEFMEAVKGHLSEGGLAVGNVWSIDNPLYDSMRRTWLAAFKGLCVLDMLGAGNRIFLGRRGVESADWDEVRARLEAWRKEQGIPFSFQPYLYEGCMPDRPGGAVLRD